MTAQEKLNKAAQSHGWANWAEVLLHNAPAHVINLIVEDAMRTQPENTPALEWRPGARVRVVNGAHAGKIGTVAGSYAIQREWCVVFLTTPEPTAEWIAESDAVVVG